MSIWLSKEEIMALPTSGEAWESVLSAAKAASASGAKLTDQNSTHDTATLAAALAGVRLYPNDTALIEKARSALVSLIDTESGRWLAIGRNLGSYIIAADLLEMVGGAGDGVREWLERFYTRTLEHNNSGKQITFRETAWSSGSNASAQEGFVYAALSAYLGKEEGLAWSWDGFRRYCGDRTSPVKMTSNDDGWQFKPEDPVGIQDAGAQKNGCRLDGAIGNDMSRGGSFSCTPKMTNYPWVGLEGAVPAALILHRAGYPAFEIMQKALFRAGSYLWELRQKTGNAEWFDDKRAPETKHLLNVAYGQDWPARKPVGAGRILGYTDWTHATIGAVVEPPVEPEEPPVEPEEPPVDPPVDPPPTDEATVTITGAPAAIAALKAFILADTSGLRI